MTNNVSSDNIWVPLRPDEVPSETMKVVNTVVEQIPELSHSAHKIIEMASDVESVLQELVEQISSDPVLVSNILKEINSSYYGLKRKIDDLHLAVVLLGFNEVKNVAIRSCVTQSLGKGDVFEGFDTKNLWEHSYLVSVCAGTFSSEDVPQSRGILLTLGLLHDIGKFALNAIAMIMKKRGIKPDITEKRPQSKYILENEEKLLGVNHNIVGGLLARKWNLSERFISVLECHHYPSFFGISEIPEEYKEEITAICISDLIVNMFVSGKSNLPEPHKLFFEILNTNPPLESIIKEELAEKLENARKFLSY